MHASLWVQALEDVEVLNDTYIFFAPDNGFKVGGSLEMKGAGDASSMSGKPSSHARMCSILRLPGATRATRPCLHPPDLA